MPAYDATHFNPPAPLAQVTLRNPSTGVTVADVALLVDSGADVTLLPRRAVEGLGISLPTGRSYEIAVSTVIRASYRQLTWTCYS